MGSVSQGQPRLPSQRECVAASQNFWGRNVAAETVEICGGMFLGVSHTSHHKGAKFGGSPLVISTRFDLHRPNLAHLAF